MRTSVTLEFLRLAVEEHERNGEDVAVVHCVHESLGTIDDADLVGAAIRRAGGTFHRCYVDAELFTIAGPINEPLARHLEAIAAQRGVVITVRESEGQIAVEVDGSVELTGGAAVLGQVFAVLCSIPPTELLAFTYTLAELDGIRAALVWEASTAVANFPTEVVRTILPIASGDVDVERHCNVAEGAVRLVVRGGELVRRQPRRSPEARANKILLAVDDPIVIFLGAGASASARIPQGDRLRDSALARLTNLPVTSDELVPAFRRYLEDHASRYMVDEAELTQEQFAKSLTLERALREEFHELSGRPKADSATVREIAEFCASALDRHPKGRTALQELAGLLPRLVLGTVNFDQLIESDLEVPNVVVASTQDFADCRDLVHQRMRGETDVLPILKVHGTIDAPETIVADIDRTSRGLPREVLETLNALIDSVDRVTWVWVGCSMRDLDLRQWLAGLPAGKLVEYWVDPLPPRSVRDYAISLRRNEWATNGEQLSDRQVTESCDVFLPMLLARAKQLIS